MGCTNFEPVGRIYLSVDAESAKQSRVIAPEIRGRQKWNFLVRWFEEVPMKRDAGVGPGSTDADAIALSADRRTMSFLMQRKNLGQIRVLLKNYEVGSIGTCLVPGHWWCQARLLSGHMPARPILITRQSRRHGAATLS